MTPDEFWPLFLRELAERRDLWSYYKYLIDPRLLEFRRSYFQRRLSYVWRQVQLSGPERVLDCGCGYGTSAIFLALNGYRVLGTTLEHYSEGIEARRRFWSKHGDLGGLEFTHQDLFETPPDPGAFDMVVAQDTLHHLEPLPKALAILRNALAPGGRLVAIEENGEHLIHRLRLYLRRGNRRVIEVFDSRLGRSILMGNENVRGCETWCALFSSVGFDVDNVEHVRLLPAPFFRRENRAELEALEEAVARRSSLLRRYFYFGLNFSALVRKPEAETSPE